MKTLSIDLETFSSVDIKERGRHNYVDSPDFEILLFGYAVDYGQPVVIDLACGESVPQEILQALFDASVKKTAWNAMFEISCFAKVFGLSRDQMCRWTEQWHDTMVQARYCAFPGSLDAAGKALGLPEDKRKIATGKSLIRLFSCPRKPTAKDPRTRVMPSDEPEKWKLYKTYNAGDVTTEMTIAKYLEPWPLPEDVRRQWLLDVVQNERGVPVDMELVDGALRIMAETEEELNREAQQITDLENPNSREQLKAWVERELSTDLADLTKETVEMLLKKDLPANVRRVLEIRQELSKAAPKKFVAMRDNVCSDGRLRGMMVFYGASRTGRWASRTVQCQNLVRTHIDGLDFARDLVKRGQAAPVRFCYGNVPDTLGQLVRTALTASGGRILTDCDYSAIEARVIAWLAGEEWALEEFRGEGKIYEATAAQMFNTPKDKIKKGNPEYELRQRGKVATLACGFGGGPAAMERMDVGHKIAKDEYPGLVKQWRTANPHIVKYWYLIEEAAMTAMRTGNPVTVNPTGKAPVTFRHEVSDLLHFLTLELPSGRKLFYPFPGFTENRFGKESLCYMGQNQKTGKWGQVETYSGKLVENIVQATARDLLAGALARLEEAGFEVIFSIHDEIVIDTPQEIEDSLDRVAAIMTVIPPWAEGLPLNAAGWRGPYFIKD